MLWITLTLVALLLLWGWRRGMRPAPNRIETDAELTNALQFLIQRGIHGGTVRFQVDEDQSRAVIFTKYILQPGNVGLRGHCGQHAQDKDRFAALCDELTQSGVPLTLLGSEDAKAFEVECGRDVDMAASVVALVFERLFDVSLGEHCVAFFEGVAITDASSLTGVPDEPKR